jgi:hypothetical protein
MALGILDFRLGIHWRRGWCWPLLALLLGLPAISQAQWQTQSILVKPGWTAVYLHVDASYQTLDQLVGSDPNNPIAEVWLWQAPSSTLQFVSSPQTPTSGNNQWANWERLGLGFSGGGSLIALQPNAAYLIHSLAATNYTWLLQGKPVTPTYAWTTTGLNLLGFPSPPANPPAFDAFLALAPAFANAATIFQYPGGNLGPTNPVQLFALHTTPVTRGQAFWMRAGTLFNNYFGPFQVVLSGSPGVNFSNNVSQYSFHLVNETATSVTVSATLLPSEPPPTGQAPIAGVPPLLVRGALITTNLTYSFSTLNVGGSQTWTLTPQGQAGSDITVVLGLNRYAMTNNNPGDLLAGILQFTDSFGFSQVDVPVAAQAASLAGLWVGNASISQVANYLKSYQTDANGNPVISSNGNYIITSINTNLGPVVTPYPLRLIVHYDGTHAVLLQRVYVGLNTRSNLVLSTTQATLDPTQLGTARRISSTGLPWSAANAPWPFAGQLAEGGVLTTTATVAYDDQATNPFLHTYHPDHDNLDATFSNELPQGSESYGITRQITLNVTPPGTDFISLTTANQTLSGVYSETITLGGLGGATRTFNITGGFALTCISTIPALYQQ